MRCPFCDEEMERGGLIVSGRILSPLEWYPAAEFSKKGLKSWNRTDGKELLDEVALFGSKYKDAFYCHRCNRVIGVFDVIEERKP